MNRKSLGTAAVGCFNIKCRRICVDSFRITRYKSFSGDSYTVHKLQAGCRRRRRHNPCHDRHTPVTSSIKSNARRTLALVKNTRIAICKEI